MAYTALVLQTNCHSSQWHIKIATRLCQKMLGKQTNTWTLCNAKVINGKHDNYASTYKSMEKELCFINNVKHEFRFCPNDFKHCMCGNKNKYVLDWHIVPNIWPVKLAINFLKEEVLLLEDAMVQWQQREALSPHCKFSTITTLLIHWLHFHVPANLDAHPTSNFGKIMCHI